jgi:hypothetical protein
MTQQDSKRLDKKQITNPAAFIPHVTPTSWNWWYQDADFDNGYMLMTSFHFGVPRPPGGADQRFIEFQIYSPEGERYFVRPRFAKEECMASERKTDVVMGRNFYREGKTCHHLYFSEGDLGCDLIYEPIVPGYQADLSWIPAVSKDFGWYMMAIKSKVSGTITLKGKTTNVTGYGYQEHAWDRVPMGSIGLPGPEHGFWGRIYQGEWSILWQNGALFVGKGNKMILESTKATTQPLDFTTRDTSVERPEVIIFKINDPGQAEGGIRFKVTKVLIFMDLLSRFKPFQKWFTGVYIGKAGYFRYLLDYDMNLKILGEKVAGKGKSWCEHHKMPR